MIYYLDSDDRINYRMIPLGDNLIESLYLKVVPDNSLVIFNATLPVGFVEWWNNVAVPIIEKSDISYVIWDLASNPMQFDHINTINNLYQPVPHYCVFGNFNLYKKPLPERTSFFPYWAYWSSLQPIEECKLQRNYNLSSLNGNDWSHRKYAYMQLAKRPYFNQMIFTFGIRKAKFDFLNSFQLTDQDLIEYSKLPDLVVYNDSDHADNLDVHISHPAFQDAYVNLVNETAASEVLAITSEKIFKPIRAHQLFVVIATVGAVQFLRDIGFDVYDDVIDHGYDLISDTRLRIEMAIQQLDALEKMILYEVTKQLRPRIERNAQWLNSQEFRDQFKLNFG